MMRGGFLQRSLGSAVSKDTTETSVPEWEGDWEGGVDLRVEKGQRRGWTLREPVLTFGDIETNALSSFICLPHNGLRREVYDVYRMMWALSLKKPRWTDLDAFAAWWNVFCGVVGDFLRAEEMIIFAYANFIEYKPLRLKPRTQMKGGLNDTAFSISRQLEAMTPLNFEEKFPQVMIDIDDYVSTLLGYFREKEEELPNHLQRRVKEDMVWDINTRLLSELLDQEYRHYSAPILTRDLTTAQQRRFRKETLSHKNTEKELQSWWRTATKSHMSHVETVLSGLEHQIPLLKNDKFESDEARNNKPFRNVKLPRPLSGNSSISPSRPPRRARNIFKF